MRVLACAIAAAVLLVPSAGAAAATVTLSGCPQATGSLTYARDGKHHVLSLANCTDRVVAPPHPTGPWIRSPQGKVATIRATRNEQTIVVDGRAVLRVHEDRSKVPGPLGLVTWSPDGRTVFYFIDPMGSSSIAADGLELRALDVAGGTSRAVARMLLAGDYWTWCGSTLVLTAGGNRLATTNKRLVAARAPAWRPRSIWRAPGRAFGSVTCAPDGKSVAVLSQRAQSKDWSFFATRWQLWRVGLDGSHTLLDAPPAGFADESPAWSPDGSALAFVRERKGYGRVMLLRSGKVFGPLASLGYSLGYYGHHDWGLAWRP